MKRLLLPALLIASSLCAAAPVRAETIRALPAECNKLSTMPEPPDPALKCSGQRASFAASCKMAGKAVVVTQGVMSCVSGPDAARVVSLPNGKAGATVTPPADTGCVLRPGGPPCSK